MKRSNDRPNVHLVVRQMMHPANSYLDLAFLIPAVMEPGWKPPKFLIFFDSIAESIAVAKFLRDRLPLKLRWMIKWFNADMSPEFRDAEAANLKNGVTWGLCCSESFGMVRILTNLLCINLLIKSCRALTYLMLGSSYNGKPHAICALSDSALVMLTTICLPPMHYSLWRQSILMPLKNKN